MNKIIVPILASFLILAIPGFSQSAETITASLTIPKGQPALKNPTDILVDDAGDIYVLSHLGITKIDSDGNKILSFSSTGVKDGQLNSPISFSFDGAGNFYVSDSGNNRIQVFDPSGGFVRRWGSFCRLDSNFDGVYNDPGPNCVDPDGAGPLEIGDGQFNRPTGIALDSAGNIYVGESFNNRVQIFDSSENFVSKFGSFGSGDGQFDFITDIVVGSSGDIYIADLRNERIQVFDSGGVFKGKFEMPGSGFPEAVRQPNGIAVDSSENIYFTDKGFDRLVKLDSALVYQGMFGNCIPSSSPDCEQLTSSGSLGRTSSFCIDCNPTLSTGNFQGTFRDPTGVTVDGLGNIVIADTRNDRLQVFDFLGVFQRQHGTISAEDGFFGDSSPKGVDVDNDGNIYVAEDVPPSVQVFDSDGNFLSRIGHLSSPRIAGIGDVAVADDGKVYILESRKRGVHIFDNDGNFLSKFVPITSRPAGIAVDDSRVYIADTGHGEIEIHDLNGNFVRRIQLGFGCRESEPSGIDVDDAGNIYVPACRNKVFVFSSSGNLRTQYGSTCRLESGFGCIDPDGPGPLELGDGQFAGTVEVQLDDAGNVYVSDFQFTSEGRLTRMQVFDSSFNFLEKFNVRGPGDSSDSIFGSFALSCKGQIVVGDRDQQRVLVLDKVPNIMPCNIDDFIVLIESIGTSTGTATSLAAPLANAADLLNDANPGNDVAVCQKLNAFINLVNLEEGASLTSQEATLLRGYAEDFKMSIGC